MKLFTKSQRTKLILNHDLQTSLYGGDSYDFWPVVKLFTPDAGATWLLTELDPETNIAFGLCDLGLGSPELGYVSIDELLTVRGHFGMPVERDRYFKASRPLSEYASAAVAAGKIVDAEL